MRSADYTRTAATLPALYQEDAESFAQVDAFLGLVDELNEATLGAIEGLAFGLGPDAALRWPHDVPLGAGSEALLAALLARYDELTQWFAFSAPGSWGTGEGAIAARRRFLAKSARLWRRRGTPRGFVDWFCTYFDLTTQAQRPFLLEHFKVPGGVFAPEDFTGTLFVPASDTFGDYRVRLEAAQFAQWYAPAHVALRVCFVAEGFLDTLLPLTAPATLPASPTAAQITTYETAVIAHAQALRELACTVVSLVDHANGIHIYGCPAEPEDTAERSIDRLDVGKLPTTGD